ncbi:MAG: alpha/beta fold hydrolase [Actinomycetota bacterium]
MTVEYPIFVPFHGEHLAAVVTATDAAPRGLAVLLQGLGAPRSHKHRLWTRSARGLAERGIASVRLDWPELGDSTGSFPGDLNAPPIAEALAVASIAVEALGVDSVGIVGNCLGAKTGLNMALQMDGCVSVGCILPGDPKNVLRGDGRTAPHRAARRLSKKAPKLGTIGRRMLRSHKIKPRIRFLPEVEQAMRRADLMLLFLGKEEAAGRVRGGLATLTDEIGPTGHRAEVRYVKTGNSTGMRLAIAEQQGVVDSVVAWFDETMPGSAPSIVEPASLDGRAIASRP